VRFPSRPQGWQIFSDFPAGNPKSDRRGRLEGFLCGYPPFAGGVASIPDFPAGNPKLGRHLALNKWIVEKPAAVKENQKMYGKRVRCL
jgi:hypothetical protein